MLTPLLVVDLLIATALLVLGLLVLLKNTRLFLNKIFFLFVGSIALWIISNYFSNDHSISLDAAKIANHLTLFFPGISMALLLVFVGGLTNSTRYKKYGKLIIGLCTLASTLALTPFVVKDIQVQGEVYAIGFGPLVSLYALAVLVPIVWAVAILIAAIRHSRSMERLRYKTIFWSLIGAVAINIATNLIIPIVNGSFALTNLGPISIVLIVGGLFYSIARHQLFDIRAVVARSVGYLLSVVALGTLYGIVTFTLLGLVLKEEVSISGQQRILFVALATAITFAFQPLRRYFDLITRRVFYKDGYDTAILLDKFNKILVASLGISSLLNNAYRVLVEYMKLSGSTFVLMENAVEVSYITGSHKAAFTARELKQLTHELSFQKDNIIVTDFIEHQPTLKRLLNAKDIGLVGVLHANSQNEPLIGYLLLGLKKDGSPYTDQDVKLMAIIASELVIAIQNNLRFEEIQNFNVTLEHKVEEATRRLKQTNDKLRALDQTKDDFISMASHQLRTPLTSIKGYVSMVLEGDAGPTTPMQKKMLNQAFISSQRMVYLISDLLNVSRLKTGKFVIEPVQTNLAKVIQDEVEQLQETAKSRNLTLTYNKPQHFPTLMLDETKLRQVIMNFMDNAIYYTPQGGNITINLVDKPLSVEFTVVDDGIGVPKHEQHHLFSKFYRAHNAKRARPDGTGLGLFMAKKVIVAQGGAIIFRSKEGHGSTFGFTFAKEKVSAASDKQIVVSHDD